MAEQIKKMHAKVGEMELDSDMQKRKIDDYEAKTKDVMSITDT